MLSKCEGGGGANSTNVLHNFSFLPTGEGEGVFLQGRQGLRRGEKGREVHLTCICVIIGAECNPDVYLRHIAAHL